MDTDTRLMLRANLIQKCKECNSLLDQYLICKGTNSSNLQVIKTRIAELDTAMVEIHSQLKASISTVIVINNQGDVMKDILKQRIAKSRSNESNTQEFNNWLDDITTQLEHNEPCNVNWRDKLAWWKDLLGGLSLAVN